MWSRRELKTNAKAVLSRGYWIPFLACLILGLLGGGSGFRVDTHMNGSSVNFNFNSGSHVINQAQDVIREITSSSFGLFILSVGFLAILMGLVFSLIFKIMVVNPLRVGRAKLFLDGIENTSTMGALLCAFQMNYMNVVKTTLFRDIKIFLWSLLFVIPGIVKSYEYRMIDFILAEDPSLSTQDVFYKTKQMTTQQKGNIFVLDLSFILWYLLCGLTFGIGSLFLAPYIEAVNAQLYCELKHYS